MLTTILLRSYVTQRIRPNCHPERSEGSAFCGLSSPPAVLALFCLPDLGGFIPVDLETTLKIIRRSLYVLLLFATLTAVAAPDWNALGNAWWAHIQYLADDKLEGRGTGTEGFAKAAAYVSDQFQKAGLRPAGENGYVQTVAFNVLQLDEVNSSLEITQNGKPVPFRFGEDGFLGATANAAPIEAQAVFIGYGLRVPEENYDDFAGVDLKGKIAVFVTGGPSSLPTSVKARYQSTEERRKNLAAAGAIGTITLPNPTAQQIPLDSAGDLYGTTAGGGTAGAGVVFKLTPTRQETVLHSFSGGADGSTPFAGVILGRDGNLYGVTPFRGETNAGLVFEIKL